MTESLRKRYLTHENHAGYVYGCVTMTREFYRLCSNNLRKISPINNYLRLCHLRAAFPVMNAPLSEHIHNAKEYILHLQAIIAKLDETQPKARVVTNKLSPDVEEALSYLEKAAAAASKLHGYFALSPDTFNPFILRDIDRTFSRFSLSDSTRTIILKSSFTDPNPNKEAPSAADRLRNVVSFFGSICSILR